ncbi:MAG: hypothetical protein RIG62_29680 [Cyclobacteriaceae bacterium]
MKLIVNCKNCKNQFTTPKKASSRINYFKKFGEKFELPCPSCNQTKLYEVDDIRAVDYSFKELILNRLFILIVIAVVSFALGFILISATGAFLMTVISALIFALLAKKNNSKANLIFNKHKVKGRMTSIGS